MKSPTRLDQSKRKIQTFIFTGQDSSKHQIERLLRLRVYDAGHPLTRMTHKNLIAAALGMEHVFGTVKKLFYTVGQRAAILTRTAQIGSSMTGRKHAAARSK